MNSLLRLLLKNKRHFNKGSHSVRSDSGMSMIELLIGTIMAFLIITPLLGLVIGLLNDESREGAKATTEEEIQSALDYIKQDLSQAIYIYDNDGVEAITTSTRPLIPNDASETPILVFWKREFKDNIVRVPGCTPENSDECMDGKFVLSLVAYYLRQDNDQTWCPDGISCPARITRFEMNAHDERDEFGLDDSKKVFPTNPNLRAPKTIVRGEGDTFPNREVLVNYIDYNTTYDDDDIEVNCQESLGIDNLASINITLADGTTRPATEPDLRRDTNSKSFYACVNPNGNRLAQVTIRGNALRRIQTDAEYKANNSQYFPKYSVTIRGGSDFDVNN
ncbi:hypothetical protein M595_1068 [Lyngbya aestuarii BL J]|uniref:Prepilin-type N-terminal cleavage/methylation domain protein n=1 Tax=Lyngbya aestuarii BL J TaxID=1348334 RepID=U7QME6_9CYAN|nr:hormogonium polysaccharide secretion pseudopilin HpsC [Lyngbya aestuarii]ERT09053.1 hypothetical protein M595_1068 [Lyngbya aestuarii BL J]